MKSYFIVTGSVYGLISIAHIWRMAYEPHLAKQIWYLLLTALAVMLSLWALNFVWPRPRSLPFAAFKK